MSQPARRGSRRLQRQCRPQCVVYPGHDWTVSNDLVQFALQDGGEVVGHDHRIGQQAHLPAGKTVLQNDTRCTRSTQIGCDHRDESLRKTNIDAVTLDDECWPSLVRKKVRVWKLDQGDVATSITYHKRAYQLYSSPLRMSAGESTFRQPRSLSNQGPLLVGIPLPCSGNSVSTSSSSVAWICGTSWLLRIMDGEQPRPVGPPSPRRLFSSRCGKYTTAVQTNDPSDS